MGRTAAFSLFELAVVLTIIGLLTGGIVAGQSLLRSAALRDISTTIQKFNGAVDLFREEFRGLPGDLRNATDYWGAADSTPSTCVTTPSPTKATCNGNGDRRIEVSTGSHEMFRFWQHLANAGLIEGKFDGIAHGSTTDAATEANSPRGRLTSSLWYTEYVGSLSSDSDRFDGMYTNVLVYGASRDDAPPINGLLSPKEIWSLDSKIDDGKPGLGSLVVRSWPLCTTASNSSNLTASYKLTEATPLCSLILRQIW